MWVGVWVRVRWQLVAMSARSRVKVEGSSRPMRAVASKADLEEWETKAVAAWGEPGALSRRRVSSISARTWLGLG